MATVANIQWIVKTKVVKTKLWALVFTTLTALLTSGLAQAELIIHPPNAVVITQNPVTSVTPQVTSVLANRPSDTSIKRLMQVLHIEAMIDELIAQQQQLATTVQNLPNQLPTRDKPSLIARKVQQQLQKILIQYSQVLGHQLDPVKRRAELVNAYHTAAKQHYSQAEVDALIGFYETPMGQQLLQKQSLVTMDFVKNTIPTMVGAMAGANKDAEDILPTLQQDIEKIVN